MITFKKINNNFEQTIQAYVNIFTCVKRLLIFDSGHQCDKSDLETLYFF